MKSNYLVLASALLISVATFAQKDQIKAAEKALKGGNSAEAATLLAGAEPLLAAAKPADKAQYFFVKGNILTDLADKKVETAKNLSDAAKAYQEVLAVEKESGKAKFTDDSKAAITAVKGKLVNVAIEQGTAKNFKEATVTLRLVYDLDPTDLEKLYYAASYAVSAQDYDTALAYYEELKTKNFSGEATLYYAKNVITDKEDFFSTKAERDQMLKLKTHTDSRDEIVPSKRGEIFKNIALILVQKDKVPEAKAALAEARLANPEDISIILTEADLYLKLDDFVTYKKLVNEILAKNPNDADLVYNLGVITSKSDAVEAEKYYKRAIEIKPDYVNAYLNLAILKLDGEKKIIAEMNKLGNTEKDNKRYAVLKKQREDVFSSAIPYLEKANELNPTNEEVATTLMNVYGALEMMDKKKALKAKMAAMAAAKK